MDEGIARVPWLLFASVLLAACETTTAFPVANAPGTPTIEQDPATRGAISGVGIEQQDIVAMADEMMRDMLTFPVLADRNPPARVIIDAENFDNQSSQRLNKNIIVDRLRTGLLRAARGRMAFVGREFADVVAQERDLKREGVVDVGTTGLTRAQAGADYRLVGRITTQDSRNLSGQIQRFSQITFEMLDLETGIVVWSNNYDFSRIAQDDVVYR